MSTPWTASAMAGRAIRRGPGSRGEIAGSRRDQTSRCRRGNGTHTYWSTGGKLAFPVNISLNEMAAHFTPTAMTTSPQGRRPGEASAVGAHVDGWLGDTATTVEDPPPEIAVSHPGFRESSATGFGDCPGRGLRGHHPVSGRSEHQGQRVSDRW